jgi:5-methyltetrahydropteroyltriglutamate--homocysteine methyltransferase
LALQHSTDRIRTTHVGSLPRPRALLDALSARLRGEPNDQTYAGLLARSVDEVVRRQIKCGIDFVTDGEYSKPGFFTYVRERLEGFEPRPGARRRAFEREVRAFPEYYEEYFGHAMFGGTLVPMTPIACVGPIRYRGTAALERDIENLKAAARAVGLPLEQVFLPATAPSGVGTNEYYASEEAYLEALAGALAQEYRAIIDAGLLLQIDDPGLSEVFSDPSLDSAGQRRRAELYVEATNAALAGVPPERVRFHTCYGINEGPRIHEADLAQVIGFAFKVNATLVSFEAANARHEHEYHLFERLPLPADKVLCPGVITHASNIVEHPELIAERLLRYALLVGRENVVAGADCGFSSQATYHTEVHPSVVWAKLEALAEGARRASAQLWP